MKQHIDKIGFGTAAKAFWEAFTPTFDEHLGLFIGSGFRNYVGSKRVHDWVN